MKFTFEHKTNNTAYLLIDKLFWGEGMNHCFAMGPGIKVRGEGRMQVIPDMATITIGMLSEHPNLQTAQTENRKVSERVVQALLELGIEREGISRLKNIRFKMFMILSMGNRFFGAMKCFT